MHACKLCAFNNHTVIVTVALAGTCGLRPACHLLPGVCSKSMVKALKWSNSGCCLSLLPHLAQVGMYATARIIAASARQHMLPPFLARVHPKLGTPYVSQIASGVATAVIALFTDFAELVDMVSISTLFAFWMVALALLWYRYYEAGVTTQKQSTILSVLLFVLVACSISK